jgi:hypothetical protein
MVVLVMRSGTARRGLQSLYAAAACVCVLALCACGGDEGGGGAAGGPALPGRLGEPCAAGCDTGLICSHGGWFSGLCTVGCTTDQSCQLLAQGTTATCFGEVNAQCALACTTTAGNCPAGTECAQVATGMACLATQ